MLHIVNNYTGDRMAFDMGKEMAEAEGIRIETVIVDDDVSVKDSTWTVGRRGVAGNFFVIKAVGAASDQGADLDHLVDLAKRVNSVTRSMGMALTSCTPLLKVRLYSSSAKMRWRWVSEYMESRGVVA